MAGLASLPDEILLHILSCKYGQTDRQTDSRQPAKANHQPTGVPTVLDPPQITALQLVSRGFFHLARDNGFWRARCLQESSFLEALDRRRRLSKLTDRDARHAAAAAAAQVLRAGGSATHGTSLDAALEGSEDGEDGDDGEDGRRPSAAASVLASTSIGTTTSSCAEARQRERVRIMANWDPCFPPERVSWYEEYIQRHGPVAVNWMQCAYDGERASLADFVEARGVALYYPGGGSEETVLAVSPLDDGSVCLWDVRGTMRRKGAIVARSRPGILFIDGPAADNSRRSKRIDSGVTECVSVDNWQHRAFFAVQSRKCACALVCKPGRA